MASSPGRPARAEADLPGAIPDEPMLRLLGRIAARRGARSFLVGGPVRDILLGRDAPDIDIAVEGDCAAVGRDIARRLRGRFVFHRRFLTGTVRLPDSSHIDLARTRTECYARPAVLPSVRPAAIEDDLVRRDFTVNALALDISPGSFGCIVDPHSGRQDLSSRRLRVLHAGSFTDDPTRIFRAIRFAVRLDFDIEPGTLGLMREAIRRRGPSLLTPERILYELRLICTEPLVLQMMEAVRREKLLRACFGRVPARTLLPGLQKLVSGGAPPDMLFVYLLSHLPVTDRFPVTKSERDSAAAVSAFGRLRGRLARARRPSTVHRLLRPVPEPALRILALVERPAVSRPIRLYLDELSGVVPRVTGAYLRSCGLRPGPAFRTILDTLLWARLDGRVTTRQQEFALAAELIRRAGGG